MRVVYVNIGRILGCGVLWCGVSWCGVLWWGGVARNLALQGIEEKLLSDSCLSAGPFAFAGFGAFALCLYAYEACQSCSRARTFDLCQTSCSHARTHIKAGFVDKEQDQCLFKRGVRHSKQH